MVLQIAVELSDCAFKQISASQLVYNLLDLRFISLLTRAACLLILSSKCWQISSFSLLVQKDQYPALDMVVSLRVSFNQLVLFQNRVAFDLNQLFDYSF